MGEAAACNARTLACMTLCPAHPSGALAAWHPQRPAGRHSECTRQWAPPAPTHSRRASPARRPRPARNPCRPGPAPHGHRPQSQRAAGGGAELGCQGCSVAAEQRAGLTEATAVILLQYSAEFSILVEHLCHSGLLRGGSSQRWSPGPVERWRRAVRRKGVGGAALGCSDLSCSACSTAQSGGRLGGAGGCTGGVACERTAGHRRWLLTSDHLSMNAATEHRRKPISTPTCRNPAGTAAHRAWSLKPEGAPADDCFREIVLGLGGAWRTLPRSGASLATCLWAERCWLSWRALTGRPCTT